ncbi:MAG: nitrate ABC transporter permease [Acidimicrobiales bacterium]
MSTVTVSAPPSPAPPPPPAKGAPRRRRPQVRSLALFVAILVAWLVVWELVVRNGLVGVLTPSPGKVFARLIDVFSDPFFRHGINDVGIGWQLLASLRRVMIGFTLAAAIAVPLGFAIGSSPTLAKAVDPFVQVLKPVSPLAWLPIGLALLKDSELTSIFVIFMSALWPVLLNTIMGVRSVPPQYLALARTLEAKRSTVVRKILLPGAMPSVVTGLRLSLGIAWLVIVAAEMLIGGRGIGYFVWNEWNNLNVASIVVAILAIGGVGLLLDRALRRLERLFSYG